MENKVCLIAGPFYGRANKIIRQQELDELKSNNRIRHIDFISLHEIKDFYYASELKDSEFMYDRLMNTLTSVNYVFMDISNADTTTAIIVAAIERINTTRSEDQKIDIIAFAEDERIYDNEYYGLIFTPVAFDQFLIGGIQKNGAVYRSFYLAVKRIKKLTKQLRIERRQDEKEEKRLEEQKRLEGLMVKEDIDG